MNKVALLTVVYPSVEKYLPDFFKSLKMQNFKEFKIIIVNDGLLNLERILQRYSVLNYCVLEAAENPAFNRAKGINFAKQEGYKYLFFGDSDDFFSDNRLHESLESLQKAKICINEITTVLGDGEIISENYFSNRLKHGEEIDINKILDKNIFGFSNTAINLDIISSKIVLPGELIAVDWSFFTKLLLKQNIAIFNQKAITYYRQYENNTIGIGNVTANIIRKSIEVKRLHYNYFAQNRLFSGLSTDINKLSEMIGDKEYFNKYYNYCLKNKTGFPFWWEPAKIPEEVL